MDRCTGSTPCLQQLSPLPFFLTKYLFTALIILLAQPLMAEASSEKSSSLEEQRALYQKAKSALKVKNQTHFKHALRDMGDYPLKHYLEAMELFERLNSYPRYDVREFLKQHDGTPIAARLRYRWLETLRRRDRWQDYLLDYQQSSATSAQKCYYQLARIRRGQEKDKAEAITAAIKLWSCLFIHI